jgi:Tol biopolymer transport system component
MTTLSAGARLGPFEVVELIGAGGMGEVYRARDPRLGRDVAIKVLPLSLSGDPDRVRRFEQEARAAGVLNHPNITAVHDIGTQDGTLYVVSELLEGETLRSRLAGGALPPRKAIDYARQIALGLAAAHEKGIVHRDLKPENLFITGDGRVKILDFGLAKLTRPEEGIGAHTNLPTVSGGTEPGVVLGTLGYMSPEQVRGKAADPRSDIFSFGAILYEMLSGRRAFHGDSAADTMSAILMKEPEDVSATNRNVPPGVERIVRHCLEKSPEERFHSAHDLAFQLQALSDVSSPLVPAAGKSARARGVPWLALALVLSLAALAAVLLRRPALPEPPRTSFLTFSGSDKDPAASPDGRLIAFVSQRDGRSRIWLKQLATGEEVGLTSGEDAAPRFSPDGSELLFARAEGAVSSLFRVALVGGEPRKMIDNALAADWSPDGSRIAFVRPSEKGQRIGSVLVVAGTDGSAERTIAETDDLPLLYPRWSPDGRTISAARLGGITSVADQIALFDVETKKSRLIAVPSGAGMVSSAAWTPSGKEIVYAQAAQLTSQVPLSRLVVQNVASGENRTVLWLPNLVWGVDLLSSGEIVFDAVTMRENLREVPLASSAGTMEEWFTRGGSVDRQPSYSPDGERIAFASTRSGNIDIWQVHRTTRAIRRLTSDPADDWDPGFTADGKNLLFSSNRGGHFEIWIADADGRRARQLTRDGVDAENPTATPDGEWIVYGSGHPQKRGIWKIRKDGSSATRLAEGTFVHAEVSPDGRHVMYHTPPDPGWSEIRVLRLADGAAVDFRIRAEYPGGQAPPALASTPASLARARWTPDGRAIAYVAVDEKGRSGVMVQDFVPGHDTRATRRPLAGFDGEDHAESFGISPDGSRLMLSGVEISPGLMLAQGVPGLRAERRKEVRKR